VPPNAAISPTTFSHFASVRPATTTRAASLASASAMPRPTPWPAPVTTATLFASLPKIPLTDTSDIPSLSLSPAPSQVVTQPRKRQHAPGQTLGLAEDARYQKSSAEPPSGIEADKVILIDPEELDSSAVGAPSRPFRDRKPRPGAVVGHSDEPEMDCLE